MKTLLAAILLGLTGMAGANDNSKIRQLSQDAFGGDLTQETALAYDNTYTYDLSKDGIKKISAVIDYGTATIAAQTFTDGLISSGTVTVASTTSLCGTLVTINSVRFHFGSCPPYSSDIDTKVAVGATVTVSAKNLSDAIVAHASLTSVVTSTYSAGEVALTSVYADGVEYPITTSKSVVTVSSAVMVLGVDSAIDIATDYLYIPTHGFTTGLPVLYTGAVAIQPLVDQTTYYAIRIDADYIQVATTSAQAVLLDEITLLSFSGDATETTYTLAPLDMDGTSGFNWQQSNDDSTYVDMPLASVSSATLTSATADTTINWDFSDVNYRYLRLNVTGPTAGGIILNTWLYLKR